jgi:hypothetical protein
MQLRIGSYREKWASLGSTQRTVPGVFRGFLWHGNIKLILYIYTVFRIKPDVNAK